MDGVIRALRAPHNWVQLAKFCAVGVSGYVINLAVYTALLKWAGLRTPKRVDYTIVREHAIEQLADSVEAHLDLKRIMSLIS